MHRLFIALAIALTASACGIRGSLEKPAGPVPPSLYDRAFGQGSDQPQQPDDANTAANPAEKRPE
ncbi:MAG: hypothetical protein LBU53_07710 [Zoogloeaceae bacterium]|nr:hypothetical protein [Zoogloeaceae bacterium]